MDQSAPSPPHGRLSQLDALRGIAALAIMAYHAQLVYRVAGPFARAYLFVDLFFLLSGFVLAVSTERKLNAGIGAFEFAWSRYKRLFPLVAVGIAVALARTLAIGVADPATLLLWATLDLAMIPSLAGSGPFYRLNGPQWTLFWELVANFVHALFLRRVPTAVLPLVAAGFGALLIAAVRGHGSDTMGVDALTRESWWTPIPRVGFPYVLGVWMGRKYKAGARMAGLPWAAAMVLPVLGVLVLPELPLSTVAGDLAFALLFLPAVVWTVAMCRPPAALLPAMDWLGSFSLPLYCVHLTILVWISEGFGRGPQMLALGIGAALIVSYAFSRMISFKAKPTEAREKPRPA